MKIVVGLGNPGPSYETTRHNAGFLAVDRLIDRWNAKGPSVREKGFVWEASVAGVKVLIIKPQTFMNVSGRCVAPIVGFFKIDSTDLIVLHDEVDLPTNALRIKTGGGAGGHNGIKSIDESLGAGKNGYHRIRIGVGRPSHPGMETADHVLAQYSDNELTALDPLLDRIADAVEKILRGDIRGAMTEYNRKDKDQDTANKESE